MKRAKTIAGLPASWQAALKGGPIGAGSASSAVSALSRIRLGLRSKYSKKAKRPTTSVPKFYVGPDRIYVKEKFFLNVSGSQAEQIATNTGYDFTIRLADMNATKLAGYKALYGAYQITAAKIHVIPRYPGQDYNQAVANAGGVVAFAGTNTLAYVSTRTNDTLVGSSYAGALIYSDVQVIPLGRHGVKRYEKMPTYQTDINPGGVGTNVSYQNGVVDIDDDDVVHKAGTFWMESEGTGTNPFTAIVTAYITFYDSR